MPQLDIDLLEDFLFFAFAALLLGFGDEDSEENVIESSSDAYLAQYYLSKQKSLMIETSHVSTSSIFTKLEFKILIITYNLFKWLRMLHQITFIHVDFFRLTTRILVSYT